MKRENPFTNYFLWAIFILFLILTFFGVINHEPWSDEAQAWLIARDLNLWGLIKQLPYEGTPGLWHILLFPIAKFGLPYEAQAWLHWLLVNGAIFIFLFFSSLPQKIKALFIFSYYPVYEYAVIARNYALAILLIFSLTALHNQRFTRPIAYAIIVSLLFQVNLLVFIPALLFTTLFIIDLFKNKKLEKNNSHHKKYLISIFIMAIGAFLAIIQVIPYPGQLHSNLYSPRWAFLSQSLNGVFLPINGGAGEVFISEPFSYIFSFLTLLALILLASFLITNKKIRIGLILSWAWLILLFLIKPIGALRHYGFFLIFLITAWWLDGYYSSKENIYKNIAIFLMIILLIPGIVIAVDNYIKEYKYNFCGGKEMAQYLKDNKLEKSNIASFSSPINMSLLPYLPNTKFWQVERKVFGTYTTYDSIFTYGLTDYHYRKQKIINQFKGQEFFLLTTLKIHETDSDWMLVTENERPSFSGAYFYLYRLSPDNS